MNTYEAIISRRSIRKYRNTPVEEEKVEKLLMAAMYAPSARNLQPWHFIVVNQRELLKGIMEVHPYAKMLGEAPMAIIVCGDRNIEPTEAYIAIDCAAATQNILLTAHDMDLATVWLGVYPRQQRIDSLSALFYLPSEILPISIVAVGYSDEIVAVAERYQRERIHINKW